MHRENRCLSDEDIGAYLEGGLDNTSRGLLESHLHNCSVCKDEVAFAEKALAFSEDDLLSAVPERLVEDAIKLYPAKKTLFGAVLSLAGDAIRLIDCSPLMKVSVPRPVFALRGIHTSTSDVILLSQSFDEVDTELAVEKISDLICNIRVIVRRGTDSKAVAGFRAGLFSGGRELASYRLNNGATVFEDVEPGLYTISISSRGRIFGEISLEIE